MRHFMLGLEAATPRDFSDQIIKFVELDNRVVELTDAATAHREARALHTGHLCVRELQDWQTSQDSSEQQPWTAFASQHQTSLLERLAGFGPQDR